MPTAKVRGDGPILLLIRMNPPWVFIDEIRRFVESFCACACPGEQDREAQLALAVHELMQNAVPHAGGDDVELKLEVHPKQDSVTVAVTNTCTPRNFEALRTRIDRMNREPDALKHYVREMTETPVQARGGLGLARVRFEAQLDLSASMEGQRVTVLASGRLSAPRIMIKSGERHV